METIDVSANEGFRNRTDFLSEKFCLKWMPDVDPRTTPDTLLEAKEILRRTVNEFDASTKTVCVNPQLLTVCGFKEVTGKNGKPYAVVLMTNPGLLCDENLYVAGTTFYTKNENMWIWPKAEMMKRLKFSLSQVQEIAQRGYFIRYMDDDGNVDNYIPTAKFLTKMCKKCGMTRPEDGYNPFRDLYIASKMRDAEPFLVLYREAGNGRKKALSCFSAGFEPLQHSALLKSMEEIEERMPVQIMGWVISHFESSLDLVFIDCIMNSSFAVGCRISFSDTGEKVLSYQMLVFYEDFAFPVGDVQKDANALLKIAERKSAFYMGFFDRLPAMLEDEESFITKMLVTAGKKFSFGPKNVREYVQMEKERNGFSGRVQVKEAMSHLLRMASLVEHMPPNTGKRFLQAIGYIFETY